MTRETIKSSSFIILGYLDTESNGDVVARDSSGRIVGYYKKRNNTTTDFSGRILYYGNCAVALIIMSK